MPVPCHSHNDYERERALYSALSAGCISVEADIYPHGDKLVVGHEDPGTNGPTLQTLYLDPIKKMLDERGSIYPGKPEQSLNLLIDFKADRDVTWDLLVQALAPLRDAGYLSHWDGATFSEGKVTVVTTGTATIDGLVPEPIAKANDDTANPGRALFVDARINKPMENFNTSNGYFASADFKAAGASNVEELRSQISVARQWGFKVRYCTFASH